MTTIPIGQAWREARAQRRPGRRRTPLLIAAARWAGRTIPPWRHVRTAAMQWTAFAAGDVALWGVDWKAGLGGAFVSLLVLEALGGERA